MPTDLTVVVEDRPGRLADVGEALGRAGVNIEGLAATTGGGQGTIHLLVEDAAAARRALEQAGIPVQSSREVLVVEVVDRPGALGELARRIANAGVNIDLAYLATRTRLVLGSPDLERMRAAIR
ncbi:MAG: ACT domain-containing protein [Armatimonadota bacterium]|nr:ACT domain-containing protein [Armatimonadota bacterium]MDR7448640.1 ACT domain-containing protein [Armatimonadota bacterium]MDR7459376.1 ACT domain-containing protein [Armatimonadota bacterium]MDR7478576.1 ACT domain-containing protein [Armatimonadota bacterium]MDR7488098.1 ACT domain-containing protein [Armatimonadota bacterium]